MKIVILGSGKGSNAYAILKSSSKKQLGNTIIQGIFSDYKNSGILSHGKDFGIHSEYIHAGDSSVLKEPFQDNWISKIKQLNPDLIVLAGFMKIIKEKFISAFNKKVINLHPSLLPSFPGLNSIKQAYEKKVKITGCTVHWVNETVDGGEIIAQKSVRIMNYDTLHTLTKKVHTAEHILLPSVIKGLSNGEIDFPS